MFRAECSLLFLLSITDSRQAEAVCMGKYYKWMVIYVYKTNVMESHNMHNINLIHLINNVLAKVWKLRVYE